MIKLILGILLSALILSVGCGNGEQLDEYRDFASYRDLPGITDEHIRAVADIRERHDFFVYGMMTNDEAFIASSGQPAGFTAHLCKWLTDFFDIEFRPQIFEWTELWDGALDGSVDFSGQFTRTPEREIDYGFAMTDPIAIRSLTTVRLADSPGLRYLDKPRLIFYYGTVTADIMESAGMDFYPIFVELPEEAGELLTTGAADAFVGSGAQTLSMMFPGLRVETLEPFVIGTTSFATANPELAPIVEIVQMVLDNGGMTLLGDFYTAGIQDFKRHRLDLLLTPEERAFLDDAPVISVAAECYGYPVSFYNAFEGEFQGIAHDILNRITILTGLSFDIAHADPMPLCDALDMLCGGEVDLAVGLIRYSDCRDDNILISAPFFTGHYALLSSTDCPSFTVNEVLYINVGLVRGGVYEEMFKRMFPMHDGVVYFDNLDDLFLALDDESICMAFSSQTGLLRLTNFHERVGFKANLTFHETYHVSMGINGQNPLLASVINKALSIIDTETISTTWMNRTFDYTARLLRAQLPWLVGALVLAGMVVVLLIIMFSLRNREKTHLRALVNERTAELELENSTSSTVFDAIPDVIFCKDLDLNYTRINRSFEEMFNKKKVDIVGKGDENGIGLTPEICRAWREWDLHIISSRKSGRTEELVEDWQGNTRIMETIKTPLMRGDDECVGLVGISRDISGRKAMEDNLRRASLAKSAFIANMSHEIRTPMNSIVGFSELALENDMSTKTRSYLKRIIENANWLLQIINDILDITKIESGKLEIEKVPFDFAEIFAQCQSLIMPMATEKGLGMYFYTEPVLGNRMLLGDPFRLRQVFINLLSNSVKFTDKGMVKVAANLVKETSNTKTIYCTITDSGIGMSQEQIDRVFEPFMQADTSITRKYGGTGLGLPIVKSLLEMMGGKLCVESTPGEGSKFSFELTFETAQIQAGDSKIHQTLAEYQKPLFSGEVLVCEDNRMNQMVISEHLMRVGLTSVIAENGLIGVDMVRQRQREGRHFDLILMDIHMPIMDGLDAADTIQSLNTPTPIVAITANVMVHDKETYRQRGMMDTIGKPFTSQELWEVLLKYLTPVSLSNRDAAPTLKAADTADTTDIRSDDEELMHKLRVSFVKDNRSKFREIADSLARGDDLQCHRLAHTLKSSAGLIDKPALQRAAANIETLLTNGGSVDSSDLAILETELNDALRELTPLYEAENAAKAVRMEHISADKMIDLIHILEPMLKSRNSECLKFLPEIRTLPNAEDLADQIESYDFKLATQTLARLKKTWGIF